ncbi:hypothetical protein PHYBLDRAFT_140938 [Phycomyces blakesleeanus NRRL 1555(-)]|uniref:Uncharacterized protein n=1 Tax=Phycomyces blakesleeanus (strain ATCC 8743b / DSM 1359 / FGSC 10004 / NBRC 33097 / NRRL 1555) TaxID=763407 RepID=A0A162UYX2_PHYB8|nr:hypothetical protein PHYBLDRAFT_140938 [Phycomyces blakesleeanus NRRL 1555(-)]OAD78883.1 hypothetical protein PHYBLDRAFT_140938 [Phycomyces blakesleeanus NRRL 1555(-)]|eukprot:XP_018296923.1 hypothetical protein PHYBLDRAFT_140938 [Phycomyces blakesleeanus NRRL 1555(-)]
MRLQSVWTKACKTSSNTKSNTNRTLVFGQKAIYRPFPKPLSDRIMLIKLAKTIYKPVPKPLRDKMLAKLTRLNAEELIGTIIDRKINSAMRIDLPRGVKRQLEEKRFVPQGLEEEDLLREVEVGEVGEEEVVEKDDEEAEKDDVGYEADDEY